MYDVCNGTGPNTSATLQLTVGSGITGSQQGVAIGDTVFVCAGSNAGGTQTITGVTDTQSHTYAQQVFDGTGTNQGGIWTTTATAALVSGTDKITVTWSSVGGSKVVDVKGASGVSSATADKTNHAGATSTAPDSGTSGTLTQASEVVFGLVINAAAGGAPTGLSWGTGTTVHATGTGYLTVFTESVSSTAAVDASATITSANWACCVATFKLAGSGLTITSTSPPSGTVGTSYNSGSGYALTATGGTSPFTWSVPGAGMPPGISLNPGGSGGGHQTGVTITGVSGGSAGLAAQYTTWETSAASGGLGLYTPVAMKIYFTPQGTFPTNAGLAAWKAANQHVGAALTNGHGMYLCYKPTAAGTFNDPNWPQNGSLGFPARGNSSTPGTILGDYALMKASIQSVQAACTSAANGSSVLGVVFYQESDGQANLDPFRASYQYFSFFPLMQADFPTLDVVVISTGSFPSGTTATQLDTDRMQRFPGPTPLNPSGWGDGQVYCTAVTTDLYGQAFDGGNTHMPTASSRLRYFYSESYVPATSTTAASGHPGWADIADFAGVKWGNTETGNSASGGAPTNLTMANYLVGTNSSSTETNIITKNPSVLPGDTQLHSILATYQYRVANGLGIIPMMWYEDQSGSPALSNITSSSDYRIPMLNTIDAATAQATTGLINGTPTDASGSPYAFTLKVKDASGSTATAAESITISAGTPTLKVTTAAGALQSGQNGIAYPTVTLAASGGTGTGKTWAIHTGTLSGSGLTLNSGGTITGTGGTAATYTFTVTVTDSGSNTANSGTFTITIAAAGAAPTITTTSPLPSGTTGTAYSQTLAASGGAGSPFTWALANGSDPLPPGISLSSAGVLSGTPASGGTFDPSFVATDSGGTPSAPVTLLMPVGAGGSGGVLFPLPLVIEILINGVWTDITSFVYQRDDIHITGGKTDRAGTSSPAQCTMTLNNRDGRFSPNNVNGPYYILDSTGNNVGLGRNTQIRVSLNDATSSSGNIYSGYRFWGEVAEWPPLSDVSGNDVYVQITASGPRRRINQGGGEGSALQRYYASLPGPLVAGGVGFAPIAYWPCEEDPLSTQIGSGIMGAENMVVASGAVKWKAVSDFNGSAPIGVVNGSTWTGVTSSFGTSGDDLFLDPGTFQWVASTTSVNVRCVGGGGGASKGQEGTGGGSGGGGGESAGNTSITVTPGKVYTVTVGTGGQAGSFDAGGTDGALSTFSGDSVTVTANGGQGAFAGGGGGPGGTGGTGGSGGFHHNGGQGGSSLAFNGGGGGASSGGKTSAGNNGGNASTGTGGTGGAAPDSSAGAGGAGGFQVDGRLGKQPGGGGGGGWADNSDKTLGANGAPGAVELIYTPSGVGASPANVVVRFIMVVPPHGGNSQSVMMRALFASPATITRLDCQYRTGGNIRLLGYNASNVNQFDSGNLAVNADGQTLMVSMELAANGTGVNWLLSAIIPRQTGVVAKVSGTAATQTMGSVSEIVVDPNGDLTKTAIGHISVQYALIPLWKVSQALDGHQFEGGPDRFIRLGNEQAQGNLVEYNETVDHWGFEDGTVQSWTAAHGAVTNSTFEYFNDFLDSWPADGTHSLLLTASGSGGVPYDVTSASNAAAGPATLTGTVGSGGLGSPHGTAAGDLVYVTVGYNGSSQTITSVTDSQSNTYAVQASATGQTNKCAIYTSLTTHALVASVDTISVNFANTNGGKTMNARGCSGVTSATADKTNTGNAGTGTAASSGSSGALSQANELVVGLISCPSTSTPATGPSFGTVETVANGNGLTEFDEIVTSTAAQTASATLSATTNWTAIIATFPYTTGGQPSATSLIGVSGQPVLPGDVASLSIDFYAPVQVSNAYVGLQWYDASGTLLSEYDSDGGGSGQPALVHTEQSSVLLAGQPTFMRLIGPDAVAPANAAFCTPVFGSHGSLAGGTLIYADNVRLAPHMGPQTRKAYREFLQEIEDLDQGILKEAKELWGMKFRTRIKVINQSPSVSLDYSQGMLSPPLAPVIDVQSVKNNITVQRHKGSKVEVSLNTGQMSVQEPPAGVGFYKKLIKTVAAADEQLAALAAHLLNVGTAHDERYPTITVTLSRASIPGSTLAPLMSAVAGVEIGDMVELDNLPFWYPSTTSQQMVIGYDETLNATSWIITWNCATYTPFITVSTTLRRW